MMVCDSAISPPPPRPCKPRATISAVMLGASAQAIEPSMNRPIAVSSIMRRPWMSESLP